MRKWTKAHADYYKMIKSSIRYELKRRYLAKKAKR